MKKITAITTNFSFGDAMLSLRAENKKGLTASQMHSCCRMLEIDLIRARSGALQFGARKCRYYQVEIEREA